MPSLLAIVPHPDDESYSFGGTLALAARAGWECRVVAVTSGEGGERHDGGPVGASHVAPLRERELRTSCAALGVRQCGFWQLPDGAVSEEALRPLVATAVAEREWDLVMTLGADGAYGHPDHLAVHEAVSAAWRSQQGPSSLLFASFPLGLFVPQYDKCVASGIMGDPPLLARDDIGDASVEYDVAIGAVAGVKLASIRAHLSQLPGGDPFALFPPGIVAGLLECERFRDATGARSPHIVEILGKVLGG
ncbi:hypothetical protein AYO38_02970 [bacterium SCGC AG-212-C10]|nr:hypothetical protein AYO38_02970 [bacterium SCGC AG-212-C10]